MTFDEAKVSLKEGFIAKKVEVAYEHDKELFFRLGQNRIFRLNESEIEEFRIAKSITPPFERRPSECSLISKDYREQSIQFLHPIRARFLPPRDTNIIFGQINEEVPYVQISKASNQFIWTSLFEGAFFDLIMERLIFRISTDDRADFIDRIYKPITIKVSNLRESSIESALKSSTELIDACIFSYSSLKDNPIGLLEKWPRRRSQAEKNFEYRQQHRGNEFVLPSVKFNPHLVRFYQLAASTDIESYKFLSYYHILEYHFVSISDKILYDKLSRRINDLKFRTTAVNLDRLIQDVNDHRTETDETEMLKNVLSKLVIEDELISFITAYEEHIKENIYTRKRTVFGTEIAGTSLQPGHVFGVIAKRMKTIRNALVHSSDRRERNSRFIPYSQSSLEAIRKEIPLIRFLAEKVIVATGE